MVNELPQRTIIQSFEQVPEQAIKLHVIWDVTTLMWHQCNHISLSNDESGLFTIGGVVLMKSPQGFIRECVYVHMICVYPMTYICCALFVVVILLLPNPSTWRIYSWSYHYSDVIMRAMASHITSLTIVYSTVYSGADQRKCQSSVSLAFVRGIHRWPFNSPHKGPVTRKMFPFDDVIMHHWHWGNAMMNGCTIH